VSSFDSRSAAGLEWPELCAAIASYAQSGRGRQLALALEPAPDQATAELRQSVMAEVLWLAEAGSQLPVGDFEEQAEALLRVERGACASGVELGHIRTCLRVGLRLDQFGAAHEESAPLLGRMLAVEPALGTLKRDLDGAIDEVGHVLDEASVGLAQARREVRKVRDEIKSKMGELISRYRDALQDGYFAERDGRYVLPVRTDAPYRVDGVVLGTSGSGSTLYVEPQELGKLGNRLRLAEGEVERQEAIVLGQLSEQLTPLCDEVRWVQEVCGRADLLYACSQFSQRIRARIVPFDVPGSMKALAARHPLLCLQLENVVPSDLVLGPEQALILSGPNAGGKTVALKALGLLAMMQSAGLAVPVAIESTIGFFEEVLCDIGDDQSLAMSLSTFSGHIERVVRVLEDAGHGTLVLFDELMGGTDPDEGAVLAIATVEALVEAGATVCVTTHYEALKERASQANAMVNGAVGFDFERMEPTFVVTMGRPGASSALIVAQRFGLPRAISERALALLPEEMAQERQQRISSEQLAAELESEKKELVRRRQEQEELNRQLALELGRQKDSRTRELARESDALRSEIKAARAEVRRVQKLLKTADKQELTQLQSELDRAARVDSAFGELHRNLKSEAAAPKLFDPARILPGQKVKVAGFSSPAEVLEAPSRGSVRVLLGVMKMSVSLSDIVSVVGATQKPTGTKAQPSPKRNLPSTLVQEVSATSSLVKSADITLDLRGQRVEDGLLLADQFIDELLRHHERGGFVLHGHGTGALKEAIRSHLLSHSCVMDARPAERDEGGDAFTVFWLAS